MTNPKLEVLTPQNSQLIFIDHQPQMAFGVPPVVALVGPLGMLIGEQIIPVARHMLEGTHLAAAWHQSHGTPHIFGLLPGRHEQATQPTIDSEPERTHEQTRIER